MRSEASITKPQHCHGHQSKHGNGPWPCPLGAKNATVQQLLVIQPHAESIRRSRRVRVQVDNLLHLVVLGEGCTLMSLLLKLRKTLPHSAGNVRKGAVSGEGVVQPLREEPTVQRDLAVVRRHLRQPFQEFTFQGKALGLGLGEGLHRAEHCTWGGTGGPQRGLQLIHDLLARILATHRVVLRGRQAVGVCHHVIGHDDASLLIRLVQRPLLPQELCTLSELQGPLVKGWPVEVS
mmetsp:Transcript_71755/g.99687  ORF Transcript_71755/g.99687 Transcript_71755/m.99687 type:complete len:235 (+) Transcript_71755:66-770(+)